MGTKWKLPPAIVAFFETGQVSVSAFLGLFLRSMNELMSRSELKRLL